MFFFSITEHKISEKYKLSGVKEFLLGNFWATVITDNFLFESTQDKKGFFIYEKPVIKSTKASKLQTSYICYKKQYNSIELYKSALSSSAFYYISTHNKNFFCSSHINMLRKVGVSIQENTKALPEFFVFRYVSPPLTLFKDIHQLGMESRLLIQLSHETIKYEQINDFYPPKSYNDKDTVDSIADQILLRLKSLLQNLDVSRENIAFLLSGGVDSSILFRLFQEFYAIDSTYSTAYPFEAPEMNREKEYSISAAKAFGTDHTFLQITEKDYIKGFLEAILTAEEPINHLQSVMFFLLFKDSIPSSKDFVIFGLGADSIFGAIPYKIALRAEKIQKNKILRSASEGILFDSIKRLSQITRRGHGIVQSLDYSRRHAIPISNPEHFIWKLQAFGSEDWVCKYYDVNKEDIIQNLYSTAQKYTDYRPVDLCHIMISSTFGHNTQYIYAKLAENFKKNIFCPFRSIDLINYTSSIDWDIKLKPIKIILKTVARKLHMPDFIITRPKSGFAIRKKGWAERGQLFDALIPLASKEFEKKEILSLQSRDKKKAMTFWNILNYSLWKRLVINQEPLEKLLEELNSAL